MKTTHWIIWLSLAILVASCDICREKEEGRVKFSKMQRQLVPYRKGEVLKFIDKEGQIKDFMVTEVQGDWSHQDIFSEIMCSDYVLFERKHIILASLTDDFKITLWMNMNSSDTDENGYYNGVLRWDESCSIHISIPLERIQENDYLYFALHSDKNGVVSTDKRHESLEINNHVYHDVIEKNKTIETTDNQPIFIQLFYVKNYGILQIKVDNENLLMLNR